MFDSHEILRKKYFIENDFLLFYIWLYYDFKSFIYIYIYIYFLSLEFFLQLNSKHLGQPVKMVSLLNFLNHT